VVVQPNSSLSVSVPEIERANIRILTRHPVYADFLRVIAPELKLKHRLPGVVREVEIN
jgi:hypothetical protein